MSDRHSPEGEPTATNRVISSDVGNATRDRTPPGISQRLTTEEQRQRSARRNETAEHEASLPEESGVEPPNHRRAARRGTPRRHLQEDHDAEAPLPPDPRILGFHPEHVDTPSTATSTPSRRGRRPRTPPSRPKGRGYPGNGAQQSTPHATRLTGTTSSLRPWRPASTRALGTPANHKTHHRPGPPPRDPSKEHRRQEKSTGSHRREVPGDRRDDETRDPLPNQQPSAPWPSAPWIWGSRKGSTGSGAPAPDRSRQHAVRPPTRCQEPAEAADQRQRRGHARPAPDRTRDLQVEADLARAARRRRRCHRRLGRAQHVEPPHRRRSRRAPDQRRALAGRRSPRHHHHARGREGPAAAGASGLRPATPSGGGRVGEGGGGAGGGEI